MTITAAGTYVVTGELTDGQLLVAADDDDKVQIVLAGATIHNEDGPAIYVQNADKCFVTLADGTENTLSDGESYAFEADSDEPYATLFARCDLTLNGGGTLNVTAAYRHAVCSKDDLVVVSGTYNISAVEDGLRGRDSVKIRDGVFAIEAGDDAFHAETKLTVDGGTVDVTSCYEGYEAEKIHVNGGETHIIASDDGVNASAADLSDDSDSDTVSSTLPNGDAPGVPGEGGAAGNSGSAPEPPSGDAQAGGQNAGGPGQGSTAAGGAAGNAGQQSGNAPTPPRGSEAANNGGAPDNAFAEGVG